MIYLREKAMLFIQFYCFFRTTNLLLFHMNFGLIKSAEILDDLRHKPSCVEPTHFNLDQSSLYCWSH